ncbi:hypothetical protein [Flavobacterium sp. FlaQc-47]|jgi:hypothetical protein|uniref:hypothetical protein n=1 Tax=Flavobacterium sp. FlaQc-47 TaxID=3374180 RepID=UPI003757236F
MKKYASLLLFALLLNGCDDGDLTVDTIDFDDTSITSQSCDPLTNNLIYRLKPQESLLIQLPDDKIINDPTLEGKPLIYDIDNSTYRVVYRAYDGTVATANICGAIPPTSPKVTQEWQATAGQIVITTTPITDNTATDGSTKITGYNHNINFKNITFLKPSGPQVQEEFSFGDYQTTVTPVVVTFSDENADYCPDTKKIYNDNTVSSLVLENIADLIVNEATPTGTPRTSLINLNGTTNKLYYRTYSGGLPVDTKSYFCTEKTPTTPAVLDTWVGQDGQANVSGIIEVTTTNDLKVFRHKIVLRNATLQKGNSTFKLATTFVLGTVTVVVP